MATYSISNRDQNKFLEMHLIAWNESYAPTLSIAIRGMSSAKSDAMCLVPVYNLASLIQNMQDPSAGAQLQITNRNGTTVVGRYGDDFSIQNSFGSGTVTLNATQWIDTIAYVSMTFQNASFIRELSKNVRMQVINVLRQAGLDRVVNGRFMMTQWYDNNMDDPIKYQTPRQPAGAQSYRENQINKNTTRDGASSGGAGAVGQAPVAGNPVVAIHPAASNPAGRTPIGMPPNTAMPPIPTTQHTQQVSGSSAPVAGVATGPNLGAALPPIPSGSPLVEGMRAAMDTAFN